MLVPLNSDFVLKGECVDIGHFFLRGSSKVFFWGGGGEDTKAPQ